MSDKRPADVLAAYYRATTLDIEMPFVEVPQPFVDWCEANGESFPPRIYYRPYLTLEERMAQVPTDQETQATAALAMRARQIKVRCLDEKGNPLFSEDDVQKLRALCRSDLFYDILMQIEAGTDRPTLEEAKGN